MHKFVIAALVTAAALATAGNARSAEVYTLVSTDSYAYTAAEPYGVVIYSPMGGSPAAQGQPSASLFANGLDHYRWVVDTPTTGHWQFHWHVPGKYSATATTSMGINQTQARAVGGLNVGENTRQALVLASSTWVEGFTVTGGSGSGVLRMNLNVQGSFTITGTPGDTGLVGHAGTYLNILSTDSAANVVDPSNQFLAWACEPGDDCDYDTTRFASLGNLKLMSTTSTTVNKSLWVDIPFNYGETFYLVGSMESEARSFNAGAVAEAVFLPTTVTQFDAPAGASVWLESGSYAAFALSAPVPEPATWALMGMGTALLALRRWRAGEDRLSRHSIAGRQPTVACS
ncbi:MAG: PEP-CTERM sorting domain-containing protein [Roseateles sp.]|uniref:PEP-CTERM sorting domain-containing protein n=1 Tax=Roseateles sp. TaxID=1971397 RepID=UPI00403600C8